MGVLMYRCPKQQPATLLCTVYLCDHFNAVSDVHFYGIRSNVNGNLHVPNVKREEQTLLYMEPALYGACYTELLAFLFKQCKQSRCL